MGKDVQMSENYDAQLEEEISVEINNKIYYGKRIVSKLNCGKYHQVIIYDGYPNIDGSSYSDLHDQSMLENAKKKLFETLEGNNISGPVVPVSRAKHAY